MQNLEGQTIEGVYASYPITSRSEPVLRKISADIVAIIEDAENLKKKPEVKIPSSYHMTLDYRGKVENILQYIDEIISRKLSSQESALRFPAMDEWMSNIDDRTIIHARPTRERVAEIPFKVREGYNAHLTLADIENTEFFRRWFVVSLDRFVDIRRDAWEESENPTPIEVNTSKVQIRGKIDGKKQLIIEV